MKKDESEWKTRKKRIDPRLDAAGWVLPRGGARPIHQPFRTEEEETDNGPADYALWLDNNVAAQAILSKAFSGELVPTEAELARIEGRSYETAEELLKRVTTSGGEATANGKARRPRARKAG